MPEAAPSVGVINTGEVTSAKLPLPEVLPLAKAGVMLVQVRVAPTPVTDWFVQPVGKPVNPLHDIVEARITPLPLGCKVAPVGTLYVPVVRLPVPGTKEDQFVEEVPEHEPHVYAP